MSGRLHPIHTPRLTLVPATADALRADLVGRDALAAALGIPVSPDWPPRLWDTGALNWLLNKLDADAAEPFWRAWFVMTGTPPLLIATCGFKGPPDADGFVEIGYGVVDSHHRQGIASEAAATLIRWAFEDSRVKAVCSHTLANDPASAGVLRRCGFKYIRSLDDPNDGRIDRFELPRPR